MPLSPSVTIPESLEGFCPSEGTPGPAWLLLHPQPLVELRAPKIPPCTPKSPLRAQGCGGNFFLLLFHPKRGILAPFPLQHPPLSLTLLCPNPPIFIQQSPWLKLPLVYFLPFNKYIYIYSLNSTFMCVYIYLSNALTKQKNFLLKRARGAEFFFFFFQ